MRSDDGRTQRDRDTAANLSRAAQYVRMSTDHQKYSTENQAQVIAAYAVRRGFEIVRTYADAGKSGLNMDGRKELQRLLGDVQSGRADFRSILVYDVSRWGRFQDVDEPAAYEYACRRVGIAVHYCAEEFENDGSMPANLFKMVKRTMAGSIAASCRPRSSSDSVGSSNSVFDKAVRQATAFGGYS